MPILTQLPHVLQTVFTTLADTASHAAQFTKRPDLAQFTARTWIQTTVLGWLAQPAATLDQLCHMAARLGIDVSPQAVDQRLDARSAACLEQVLYRAMTHLVAAPAFCRRRLRKEARDKGHAVSAAAFALAAWTIMITNVPADPLSMAQALVLLRARWHIELLFKLWKSHG